MVSISFQFETARACCQKVIMNILLTLYGYFMLPVMLHNLEFQTRLKISNGSVSSPVYLRQLATLELIIYSQLVTCQLDDDLVRYMNDYRESMVPMNNTVLEIGYIPDDDYPDTVSKNPILGFRMIYRLNQITSKTYNSSIIDAKLKKILRCNRILKFIRILDFLEYKLPPNSMYDVTSTLLRLHFVYNLNAKEIAIGIINGENVGGSLNAYHCLHLGLFASKRRKYHLAIEWLELAKEKMTEPDWIAEIDLLLLTNARLHDRYLARRYFWKFNFFKSRILVDGKVVAKNERVSLRNLDYSNVRRSKDYINNTVNFWSLCNGENHQTEKEKSELKCWYEHKSNPYWLINPIKTELLSKNPIIVQMYEMLNDKAIKLIQEEAGDELVGSHVIMEQDMGQTVLSPERISVSMWLPRNKNIGNLAQVTEKATGLKATKQSSIELYQVAAYSFGGLYLCHLDGFQNMKSDDKKGNRIATIMFYLNNVEKGGFTAFPQAGVAVRPVKGSAIFWYNLFRNGEQDFDTYHCACPVLLGQKWITTGWIRYYDQFLTHPCGLKKENKFSFP